MHAIFIVKGKKFMITQSFDCKSDAIINPPDRVKFTKCDAVIITFSNEIEEYVINKFQATKVDEFFCANGKLPVYKFSYDNKTFGFYKTPVGAAISVCMLEDVTKMFDCKKFVVFGSAGTLDKKCYGKVMIPTFAYRDEGTSYHYVCASDYIEIKNHKKVADFMSRHNIPYEIGKTWTTDAFYRETKNNLAKRQKDGCIAVDMECSAMQAVCDFRNLDLYYFFLSGDLLDAPKWDKRGLKEAHHNFQNFDIALHLACEI